MTRHKPRSPPLMPKLLHPQLNGSCLGRYQVEGGPAAGRSPDPREALRRIGRPERGPSPLRPQLPQRGLHVHSSPRNTVKLRGIRISIEGGYEPRRWRSSSSGGGIPRAHTLPPLPLSHGEETCLNALPQPQQSNRPSSSKRHADILVLP